MFNFIHIADTHFSDNKLYLRDSLESQDFIEKTAIKKEVKCIIHAGDLWDYSIRADNKKNSPFNLVTQRFKNLSKIVPILIIKGNHDADGSLLIFNDISDRKIIATEDSFRIIGLYEKNFYYIEEFESLPGIQPEALFFTISYPEKNKLLTIEEIKESENLNEKINEKIKNELTNAKLKTDKYNCPKIIVFHGSIKNYKKCEGQYSPGGEDFQLEAKSFNMIDYDYVAMGHIHNFQTFAPLYPKVCYSGSTWSTNYSETDDKFLSYIEIDNKNYKHEPIKINCRKRIQLIINLDELKMPVQELEKIYEKAKINTFDYFDIKITCKKEFSSKIKHIVSTSNIKIAFFYTSEELVDKTLNKLEKVKTINDEIELYFEYINKEPNKEVNEIILNAYKTYKENLNTVEDVT